VPPPSRQGVPALRWATPVPPGEPTAPTPVVKAEGERAAEGEGTSGPRSRGRRLGAFAIAALLILVAAGTAAYLLNRSASPPAGPQPPAGAPALGALESMAPPEAARVLVAATNSAQAVVRAAVGQACSSQPPASPPRQALVVGVGQALSTERAVFSLVRQDAAELSSLPRGPLFVSQLERLSAQASAAAGSYRAWLEDLQVTGCYSAPTNNLDYVVARREEAGLAGLAGQLPYLSK